MIEQILLIIGAAIFGVLGALHLYYTFFTNMFMTHDRKVAEAMKTTSPAVNKSHNYVERLDSIQRQS